MMKCLLILMLTLNISNIIAGSFFVSPDAELSGNGSFTNPWQLQTALNNPAVLQPGDTVWLRGGVYKNNFDTQTSFSCYTNGTADSPIIFRNYKYERAIIDGQQTYSLYLSLGKCSYTWFWGIEVTNLSAKDRNQTTPGSITCTAENIRFINMIVHDMGSGIDSWKSAKNSETYGCIIYHIGNNLDNNGNLEGHGHGMYLQNDTVGTKNIHNNIVFSTYGYGIKIWQTTTTAAIGNFDIQRNIVFNGGAASDNLGGVGNNSRTHNFFVVSNGENNPVCNTVIKHNYTFAGTNTPRPPVNAFGLNFGVKNLILDSNYLTCQTRLGFNNTPIFDASVKGNKIIGGIPSVYGVYLWGFLQTDFPENIYIPNIPSSGKEYFVIPNKYEQGRAHLVIYNWDSSATVQVNVSNIGLLPGDEFELVNAMDYFNDKITYTYNNDGNITVPMTGHTFTGAIGSTKPPVSQFPIFGAFVIRKKINNDIENVNDGINHNKVSIFPNPASDYIELNLGGKRRSTKQPERIQIYNTLGECVITIGAIHELPLQRIDISHFPVGLYFIIFGNYSEKFMVVR